jgi:hypothetical protein
MSINKLNKQNLRKSYRWYFKNIYNIHKLHKEKGGKKMQDITFKSATLIFLGKLLSTHEHSWSEFVIITFTKSAIIYLISL